ncbi:glycosyltransferase family 4 protein [Niabella insulamsoli]|uniref:glycosyltransferase family 4 protein n=1 Tax=Niabella insulamsoli TaxID=3144874 RepID=UPI0031FD2F08
MNIGFDAKRAYHNKTGLGFFSRVLINLLASSFPQHQYYLFNPKPGALFRSGAAHVKEVRPQQPLHRWLNSAWRSKWVVKDLQRLKIDLYHGPSQEIPMGIPHTGIPSVVTIHDLFPELYPGDFKPIDVKIYRTKLRYACKEANKIMAISEETKNHIIDRYQTDPAKIDVAYQSCDPIFTQIATAAKKEEVRIKYNLPQQFFLHVGTIIERKNLLNICKAIHLIHKDIPTPLVVIGKGGAYKQKCQAFLEEHGLQDRVIFLFDHLVAAGKKPFIETEDFPALYQSAIAMIYPSFYEGFGMPIIEAMSGGVPVITSTTSCLPEIAGDAAFLADPQSPVQLAEGLTAFYDDAVYRQQAVDKGLINAKRFAADTYAASVMNIYQNAMS